MTSTYTFLATYPADTTPARRWEIWDAVAPLFERHGFHGVTIDELAAEAGLRTSELFRHFPSKQVLALFPLSRSNGIYQAWVRRVVSLPRDPEVRRRAMLDFAAEHAVAWRLALDLATEMIMTPPLDRYAGRLVKEAREDFGAIVASVDLKMTPGQYMRLYKALHQVVTPDAEEPHRPPEPGCRVGGRHDLLADSLVIRSAKPGYSAGVAPEPPRMNPVCLAIAFAGAYLPAQRAARAAIAPVLQAE